MNNSIPDTLFAQFREFVVAQMGLYFPTEHRCDLEYRVGSAAQEFGFEDTESCIQWLMSSPLTKEQTEILASHLTIGETYFFRNNDIFEVLERHVLPELVRSRRGNEQHLRIWSAGCSTGEEPYSIAILLNRSIADLKNWHTTILATDINPHSLQKASEGVYREWSFRSVPSEIKKRYFNETKDGLFEIPPHIKNMVTFSYLNLMEDAYPSFVNNTNAMDIIFCRNVLMYFPEKQRKKVIQQLHRSLVDGGWLIVSASETSQSRFSQFETVTFPQMTFYRKGQHWVGQAEEPEVTVPFSIPQTAADPDLELRPEVSLPVQTDSSREIPDRSLNIGREPQLTPYEEAMVLYAETRYEEAAEKLAELFSHNESNPDERAIALLTRIRVNQGKLSEALEWCVKAIAADKLNPSLHHLHAAILQEQGQVEEAVLSLRRTIYLDRNFVLAHFALGNLTRQQGKLKESNKHFENALVILRGYQEEEILPESDGVTAGRLSEIIVSIKARRELSERKASIR